MLFILFLAEITFYKPQFTLLFQVPMTPQTPPEWYPLGLATRPVKPVLPGFTGFLVR